MFMGSSAYDRITKLCKNVVALEDSKAYKKEKIEDMTRVAPTCKDWTVEETRGK